MNMKRVFALLLAALLLCGCTNAATPETEPIPTEATVAETQAPTEPSTEAAAEVPTEPETTESETQPEDPEWLHSGIREDGSFDEGTLFIGDSLTYGMVASYLPEHQHLGDARYITMPGATILAYFVGPVLRNSSDYFCYYSPEFEGLQFHEAVGVAGEDTTAIYFMMGTNYSKYATDADYIQIVEHMLESCPNATVYIQLVPYDRSPKIDYETANQRVWNAYEHFQEAGEERVMLIDTQTAIDYNLGGDGIHLTVQGQENWYNAIVAFAEENNIPQ